MNRIYRISLITIVSILLILSKMEIPVVSNYIISETLTIDGFWNSDKSELVSLRVYPPHPNPLPPREREFPDGNESSKREA